MGKEKEINLNIVERIHLLGGLPREGSILTLRILRELRESIGFSEKEITDWEIVIDQTTGSVSWNPNTVKDKKFIFSEVQVGIIKKGLESLDKNEKMTLEQLGIYERMFE